MTRLVRAELLHLRSLKSTYFTAATIVLLAALVAYADFSDAGAEGMDTARELRDAFMSTVTLIPAIGLGLFAASRTAAEFRYDTVAHRALAAPRRRDLVIAKLLALAPFAAVVTGIAAISAYLAAALATSAGDPQLQLSAGAVAAMIAGPTLFACLGVAAGFLSRNQTTAVLIVFGGWVAEQLLAALTESAVFLPYALLGGLAEESVAAGLGLAALTAAALASASLLLNRKDVI